jgi:hypothetical protein
MTIIGSLLLHGNATLKLKKITASAILSVGPAKRPSRWQRRFSGPPFPRYQVNWKRSRHKILDMAGK